MRNRSSALAITNNTKKRLSTELNSVGPLNEDQKVEKINQFLEKMNMHGSNTKTVNNDYHLSFAPPKYLDIKKEYISKDEKPVLFHDKAKICSSLSKKVVGDIESYSQHVDFTSFLAAFKTEDEIDKLEIQDLLNIDYEKIGELKEKVWSYIELASSNNKENQEEKDELVVFLCEKLSELKRNEINIQVFVNNIDNVDSICYSGTQSEVYFSK